VTIKNILYLLDEWRQTPLKNICTVDIPLERKVGRANKSSNYNCQTFHDIYTWSIGYVGLSTIQKIEELNNIDNF